MRIRVRLLFVDQFYLWLSTQICNGSNCRGSKMSWNLIFKSVFYFDVNVIFMSFILYGNIHIKVFLSDVQCKWRGHAHQMWWRGLHCWFHLSHGHITFSLLWSFIAAIHFILDKDTNCMGKHLNHLFDVALSLIPLRMGTSDLYLIDSQTPCSITFPNMFEQFGFLETWTSRGF